MTLKPGTHAIETERLTLRRIEPADLDFYAAIHADPDVARYIANGKPRSRGETEAWLDTVLSGYRDNGLGPLAVIAKSDQRLVGRCGLSDSVFEIGPQGQGPRRGWFFRSLAPHGIELEAVPELGYTFSRDSWGNGYASEAAEAIYRYARAVLNLGSVCSVIHDQNAASLAVARKFGVRYVEQVELYGMEFQRYAWPMG